MLPYNPSLFPFPFRLQILLEILIPSYIKIPKLALVCDACNSLLEGEDGKVYKNCNWNEWGFACKEQDMKDLEVYERFKEGDILLKSQYRCTPMKIVF